MRQARHLRWHSGTARRGSVSCTPLAALLILAILPPAAAQGTVQGTGQGTLAGTVSAAQPAPASADALKQREQELEAARLQQKNATEQQTRMKAEIAAIGEDRSKLNQQLID